MTDVMDSIDAAEGFIPRPSLKERDRRHSIIRQAMARDGLDILILSPNTARWEQMMADSRYVTGIGSFATEVMTLIPIEKDITAYVYNRAGWWKRQVNWISDVRDGGNRWGANAIERIRECGCENGRIGISEIAGLARAPYGTVTHATVEAIKEAFPNAKIVDATQLMQDIRAVKSDEEVAFLTRSAAIIEKMIDVCAEKARPGVREKDLYGAMIATLLANDGELPNFLLFATGPGLERSSFVPTNRKLGTGDRIVNEIEAKYGGYGAQAVAPMILGTAPANYKSLIEISAVCFKTVLEAMRPGVTFGELNRIYEGVIAREGKGKLGSGIPLMHARGLGDDGPALLRKADLQTFEKIPLKQGMTFIMKPRVIELEGKERVNIGDTVAVTANGAKRLGTRPMELLEIR